MARDNSAKARRRALERAKARKKKEHQRKIKIITVLLCTVAAFTVSLLLDAPDPTPMHTSMLTGQRWLLELIKDHPERFREQLGMAKHAFF
ncbi:hypothetical protein B0H16DRAFT_133729 [Mycena metata]|uniref:Uncharacterized protein n=1 Tax=Mycena metata TaxID=1033252 RepID=A0AAD7I624_9AGAR|nr:hypothetical protein B0H16DRAFT_133729 [Mycena metata]